MLENKYFHLAVMGGILVIFAVLMLVVVPAKIKRDVTRDVMQQLQREYAPGPYSPGFDPDKVPPRLR